MGEELTDAVQIDQVDLLQNLAGHESIIGRGIVSNVVIEVDGVEIS